MEIFDSKIRPFGFYYCPFLLVGRLGDEFCNTCPPKADIPQSRPAPCSSLIDTGGGVFRQGVRLSEVFFINRKSPCVVQ
jgi:hypothetical protein